MSDNQNPVVSTGRGGAGNVGRDPNVYTDGSIVREGFQGESPEGNYSSGRGGAGNVVGVSQKGKETGQSGRRGSQDMIPETALVDHKGHENYLMGRGGQGNFHVESKDGKPHESLLDKAKKHLMQGHGHGHTQEDEKPAAEES